MEIQDNISGAISTCFLLYWTIWTEASDPTISPESAFSIGPIDATQQQRVEGGLTAKVYLLLSVWKSFPAPKVPNYWYNPGMDFYPAVGNIKSI